MVETQILQISHEYGRLSGILPEEIEKLNFEIDLATTREKIIKTVEDDKESLKNLFVQEAKTIDFQKFASIDYIIMKGFFKKGQPKQDKLEFFYAHWIMVSDTLDLLSKGVVQIAHELKNYYSGYIYGGDKYDKRGYYARFARTYMDFNGYLVNLQAMIIDYHDMLVRTCNLIDPKNKQSTIIAFKSVTAPDEMLSSVKELLLLGNYGRLSGFPLLRATLEVFMTRELFDMKKSYKFRNLEVVFKRTIPSVATICKSISTLGHDQKLGTDAIMRVYDIGSIVMHRGIRADEYVTWFLFYAIRFILGPFYFNLDERNNSSDTYRDELLGYLKNKGLIDIE